MPELLDASQIKILLGEYGAARATALKDPLIHPRVQGMRRSLSARMAAVDKKSIRKKVPEDAYHLSRKIDGEFTVLVVNGDEAFSVNPGGTVRTGLPFMAESVELVKKAGVSEVMIAGELFFNRQDGKRPRVHDVVRVARNPGSKQDLELLHFAVFDLMLVDNEPESGPFSATWSRITEWFGQGRRIYPVDALLDHGLDSVEATFEQWVEKEGSEGLVLRSEAAGMFKIKPRHTIDVAVIGFTEGSEERTNMLHDALIAVMRPEGTFHILGRVGGGYKDEQRCDFLSRLRDMVVESEYHEIGSERTAYQMVRPEWVFEISCLDFITETSSGSLLSRMVLNWDHQANTYRIVRHMPNASVISPQFLRLREDKTACYDDVPLQQILDFVDVPQADKNALNIRYPESTVLRREVRTKVLKGATMVRKLLMWQTNKDKETDEFPAYVVYVTDFSPNRKEPLSRDIRVSNAKEQADAMWDELESEYFVKGWKAPGEAEEEKPKAKPKAKPKSKPKKKTGE